MESQEMITGTTTALLKNTFTRPGYTFSGWGLKPEDTKAAYLDQAKADATELVTEEGQILTLYALWNIENYSVSYMLNGGTNSSKNPKKYNVESSTITLAKPTRKGYTFQGWYNESSFTTKVTKITAGSTGNLKLYAKWAATTYKITYKLSGGKNNSKNPKTFKITTSTITLKNATRSGYYFAGWYTSSKYKTKVTKIKKGTTGNQTVYAKWIKEYTATSTSAKVSSCKATGKNTIKVTAKVAKRLKSSDTNYYLVTIDPNTGAVLRRVAKASKATTVTFKLDTSKDRGYALAKYAVAIKKNGKYVKISKTTSYITNPQKLAVNTSAYRKGTTKKGLQTTEISHATATGADNIFMNLNISTLLQNAQVEPVKYTYNGKTYTFGNIGGYYLAVKAACDKKINVTMQICLDEATMNYDSSLIAKEARTRGHLYYTWNTKEKAAREKMEAIFAYLGEHFGTKECFVSNWILGNEVNSAAIWNYRGSMSDSDFMKSYAYSFRALYNAVRSYRGSSRIYTCVDNIWKRGAGENHGFNTKDFLDQFESAIKKQQSGVEWNIAYHPYSVRIDYPEFWNMESYYNRDDLVNNTENTQFITMKNLSVFTNYVKSHFGSDKRVIISEIGFDSNLSTTNQAAALCYAYNIAACNSMVDAFIIRSYNDEAGDGSYHFGIAGREAYQVFCKMDTSKAESYTNKYLPTIGASSWGQAVPGYSLSRIKTNK